MSSVYIFCAAYSNVSFAAPSSVTSLYLMNSNFCSIIYSFLAGYSNNAKVLRMEEERENLEIGLQEETVKTLRKKKSSSKILNRLKECLEKRLHPHMLYFTNDEKDEFEVNLKHQRNKEWAPECIRLFRDLDKIKGHNDKVPNYSGATRGRFRSNMGKLCKGKYLKKIATYKIGKSLTVIKYKILTKGSGKEEPNCHAVKKVNRCRNKYGKIISGTLDGPPPNNRMRTASPLVLPGNNIQDTGANLLNELNPYDLEISEEFVKRKICEIMEDLNNYELNYEDKTHYDNEYKETLADSTYNAEEMTLADSTYNVEEIMLADSTYNMEEMTADSTYNMEEMTADSMYNEEKEMLGDSPLLSITAHQAKH